MSVVPEINILEIIDLVDNTDDENHENNNCIGNNIVTMEITY